MRAAFANVLFYPVDRRHEIANQTLGYRYSVVCTLRNRLGPIHTKDARFFCCGNSAADISKPHTFKWDPLADDVLEAA